MSGYRLWKECDSRLPVVTQISILLLLAGCDNVVFFFFIHFSFFFNKKNVILLGDFFIPPASFLFNRDGRWTSLLSHCTHTSGS